MNLSAVSETPRRARPVLGFMVDRVDDSYQSKLFAALTQAAGEAGASLTCFCAGPEYVRAGQRQRHHAFHLASPDTIDALLVSTPTLVSALGREELNRQLRRFAGKPVVSIGAEVDGVASITLDNQEAMQRIVGHLIAVHKCKRVAFIRGPISNSEAQDRYRGYTDALGEAQLGLNPELVVNGNFHPESGAEAVRTLLDERHVRFDALVASNDDMAVAAIHELQTRGVRVPAEVKVTGFDDDIMAQHELPSLTTMRQSVTDLAQEAVQLAVTGLGIDISERRHLRRTELVIRRSCGCPLEREQFSVTPPKRPEHGEQETPLIQKRTELLEQMRAVGPNLVSLTHCELLLDAFFAGLMNKSVTAFVESWDTVLRTALERDHDLKLYQSVTTALRRGAVPALLQFPSMLLKAETMLHEARVLLGNVIHQRATQRQLRERRLTSQLCDVAQSLIVATDGEELANALTHHLRDLGIPSCCLTVYDPCHVTGAKNRVRLVLWYRDSEVVLPDANQLTLYEAEVISGRFLLERSSVVLPLCFGDKKLGVGVFEVGPRDGRVYEALRAQTSAALEATLHRLAVDEHQPERDTLVERAALELGRIEELRRSPREVQDLGARQEPAAPEPGDAELGQRLRELSRIIERLLDLRAQPNTLRAASQRLLGHAVGGAKATSNLVETTRTTRQR